MVKTFVVILVACPLTAYAGFTEVPQFGDTRTQSVNWGDMDNDGDPDLVDLASDGEGNRFYINEGDGTFTEIPDANADVKATYAGSWGDCDNDGDLDLAVGCDRLRNYVYVNDGAGNFEYREAFGKTTQAVTIGWADYDLDGDLDVALAEDEGLFLYENNGEGYFKERHLWDKHVYSLAWGDVDGDGDPDLAVGCVMWESVQNRLFENTGDGFILKATFRGEEAYTVAWGDYDNDGDLDLAVTNMGDEGGGTNYLYVNMGDYEFAEKEEFGARKARSIAWGDYDNNGYLDAAVGNDWHEEEISELYANNGDGTFSRVCEFRDDTRSVAWADYDNDGDLDLAAGRFGWGAQSYLYVNDENDGDYLSVHLVGHYGDTGSGYSNSDGIGAKVLVFSEGHLGDNDYLLGFREIEANGGNCGQDSIEAEFGLPNDETVNVRIIWPGSAGSHITQGLITDKAQFLTVHESIFHLLSPPDGEDVGSFPVTLDWGNAFSGGADPYDANLAGYTVQIATDRDFEDVVFVVDASESEYTLDESSGLGNGTYYWRVLANYVNTPGHYSQYSPEVWSFTLSTVDIALEYFDAESVRDGVELSWATDETELAGFNLYRSDASEGTGVKAIKTRNVLNAELITGESPYTYLDVAVEKGVTYDYWLEAIDAGGAAETFGPAECTWNGALPTAYALYQSRPNPARGSATIAFDLPEDTKVTLTVYDVSGRKVMTAVNGTLTAGEHEATVSGLAPGVYVYKLETAEFSAARKMVIQ